MSGDLNPYEAPQETGDAESTLDVQTLRPDYPGGLKTALGIGIVGGIATGLMYIGAMQPAGGDEGVSFLFALVTWCGSFALVGWLLPGSSTRRRVRGLIALIVSFPAIIL